MIWELTSLVAYDYTLVITLNYFDSAMAHVAYVVCPWQEAFVNFSSKRRLSAMFRGFTNVKWNWSLCIFPPSLLNRRYISPQIQAWTVFPFSMLLWQKHWILITSWLFPVPFIPCKSSVGLRYSSLVNRHQGPKYKIKLAWREPM